MIETISPVHAQILRRMTPDQRWQAFLSLRATAITMCATGIRARQPELTQAQAHQKAQAYLQNAIT